MSFNQSKSDKSDAVYRKSGRSASFNQQRGSSGGAYVKGGSGGGGAAPSPSLSSSRSFNKKSNNAQGGQSRVNTTPVDSSESSSAYAIRTIPNGSHVQSQFHGGSHAPVTNATVKPFESSISQRSSRVVPKAPSSQSSTLSSDPSAPTTPAKAPGDASMAFPFQFGSISPGFINGMAIPARTSSAPPNLDEQKRDQAHHDSLRPVPSSGGMPPVPKQQPVKKDTAVRDQSSAGETHTVTKTKKETQVLTCPTASQMQKPSVVPLTGISIAMPYHQPQASVQFGGPNAQIQSQGMSTSSLQMPLSMSLPIENAAQVQQVFVPGLQRHHMHPQGIMHQSQNMSFTPQMAPQLPHQLGSMGIGIGPQYSPQQGGKFAAPRKTTPVKITHPETHEELKLDKRADAYDGGSSGTRSHSSAQSQPVQPFPSSHPINYYPSNSYSASSLFYPPPSSLPLASSQITPNSQPPRFNYMVSHGPQNVSFMNSSSHSSLPVNKVGSHFPGIVDPTNPELSHDVHNANSFPPGATSLSIKPRIGPGVVDSLVVHSDMSGVQRGESPISSVASGDASSSVPQKGSEISSEVSYQHSKLSSDSSVLNSLPKQSGALSEKLASVPPKLSSPAVSEDSVSLLSNNEGIREESFSRLNSLKDNQKKGQLENQVAGQSPALANVTSHAVDGDILDTGVSGTVGNKANHSAAITNEDLPVIASDTLSAPSGSMPCDVEVKSTSPMQVSGEEGPAAQAVDTLSKKDDSQQEKLLKQKVLEKGDKTKISYLQGCEQKQHESPSCTAGNGRMDNDSGRSTSTALGSRDVLLNTDDIADSSEDVSTNSCTLYQQSDDIPVTTSKHCKDSLENAGSGPMSLPASGTIDIPILEPNKVVKSTSKGKKKRKEILQKADAAGSTSDLYNAYKGPEEKKDAVVSSEKTDPVSTSGGLEQLSTDVAQPDVTASKQSGQSKAELNDWEDAADMSTPKLEVSGQTEQLDDVNAVTVKNYSRDFLLKFAEQCTDLPHRFKIKKDIAKALMSANVNNLHVIEHDSHPSPGRLIDRPVGMSRRGSGAIEEDKWSKVSGAFHSGMRLDGIGGNTGFRPGQGGNFGVLRGPHTPPPYAGGILSGPMQSMGNQGGMPRNTLDSERWQRATNFQKRGLIPSPTPQGPLQMMHKAEKKYEVGKVTDVEQAKQRQLKAILNKLTPQNFEKLFERVKAVKIDNAVTLTGIISQIFEKALMEPTFCEMYANFCSHLAAELPDFSEDNEKITFKRLLLNKCQEEFERGEREQEEANKADEGEVKQSNEEREEKRTKARRRMLGNIRLIGELYKKKMLTERIMHECIKKLLGQYQDPDEEDIEALCKLMSTIGEMIDHPKAKEHIDVYFERMRLLSNNMNLSSRVRFMLKDSIDLRKNKWQQRRKVEGPKKLDEVHRDALQDQAGRLGRGPGNNPARRNPMDFGPRNPMDFGPRASSMLPSPNAQMGGLRGPPPQIRGYGIQDVRMDERQPFEARILRPLGDDVTLGPQGGLARGMSIRGSTAVSSSTGPNGYTNISETSPYSSREDHTTRYVPDRFAAPTSYDQSNAQERSINYGNRDWRIADRNLDRPVLNSPTARVQGTTISKNSYSEGVLSEERLQDMSMAAIREYYSARDVKEVVLCVEDLNSPSFHPSLVSIWVMDSFERKDTERDLLAQLLVNLVKSYDGTLSQAQLIKGFESVLSTLEDAVNDAPKAAEFLGRIFAKSITEHVISLEEIGRLVYDGGEEPGSLLETGLAADVIGSTLEAIKMEKGDAVLSEIRTSSNLQLEMFRPPGAFKLSKLEKFI